MKRSQFLVLFLTVQLCAFGQGGFDSKDPITFKRQVKQLDEFMSIFNREHIPVGLDSTAGNLDEMLLLSLFDVDFAEQNAADVMDFIESIVRNNEKLSYNDTGWYALANCHVTIDKKETEITLVLKVEFIDPSMYKWVIVSAFGDELSLTPLKRSKMRKIFPLENEVDFMQLSTITSHDQENILNYSAHGFIIDQTSVFYALVSSKRLEIRHVSELTYQFQTKNHMFWIKFFARETTNSGWLIYDIKNK